jgi:hypothetical protein
MVPGKGLSGGINLPWEGGESPGQSPSAHAPWDA